MRASASSPPPGRWPDLVLKRPDQFVAGAFLAAALMALGLYLAYQAYWGRGLVDIDQSEPQPIRFLVDVNEADWPELALLPNVGQQLARRIVEHRNSHGPFRDLDQLQDVRGIGPKTFESVKPYLMPIPDIEATAGEEAEDGSKS